MDLGLNNATAVVLSPDATTDLLARRHGAAALDGWRDKVGATRAAAGEYDRRALAGQALPEYHFNDGVLHGDDVAISDREIRLPGWDQPLTFKHDSGFDDYR